MLHNIPWSTLQDHIAGRGTVVTTSGSPTCSVKWNKEK